MASSLENKPLGLVIYDILREAQAEATERRAQVRYAFFRPAYIRVGEQQYSGFSREISEAGIGLLHNFELRPGEVEVTIPTNKGYSAGIRTRIIWCQPCGEGWYISGGTFIGIADFGSWSTLLG